MTQKNRAVIVKQRSLPAADRKPSDSDTLDLKIALLSVRRSVLACSTRKNHIAIVEED